MMMMMPLLDASRRRWGTHAVQLLGSEEDGAAKIENPRSRPEERKMTRGEDEGETKKTTEEEDGRMKKKAEEEVNGRRRVYKILGFWECNLFWNRPRRIEEGISKF
ncbi:hypothetical protein DM860_015459 [Cuscuta australis]|uniref:Uncharacterized protein n=1 Tax=Cuscuta australis TaxID=267555 RepID=A0A328EB77_9ASTE|nr:hypothetical protein DM860_015459 [Cuscuta australis]